MLPLLFTGNDRERGGWYPPVPFMLEVVEWVNHLELVF